MDQDKLNTPLADPTSMSQKSKDFLKLVMRLLKEGKIKLHVPDSLINFDVYDKLSEEKQGKVDLEAVNLITAIRDIHDLHEAGHVETYQMANLVDRVHNTKQRLEKEGGDLFII